MRGSPILIAAIVLWVVAISAVVRRSSPLSDIEALNHHAR
jgi:hypothetical protein